MDCKKCGRPIKEGNSFCTNCGREVNSKEKITTKLNIEPRYIIISIVVVAVIVIMVAVGMVIFTRTQSASINSIDEIENVGGQVQEGTQPKIEIGVEYNITTYGVIGYFKFENETIFSMCTGIANSEGIMVSGNYKIEGDKIKLTVTYDSTLIDPAEPTNQLDEPYEIEMTILSDGTIKYVNMAGYTEIFDKNAKAQEGDTSIVQENLLERIYAKYPELKGTEGIICTDGELYWLLDESGNKDYFYSFEEFDVKWQKYNEQSKDTNNVDNSNITNNTASNNTTDKQAQNNNSSNTYNWDAETKRMIHFTEGFELEDYTDQLDEWGLKYKVVTEENYKYVHNVVSKIEPNNCYVDKNTNIVLTVTSNTYDLDIMVDTEYLVRLSGIERGSDENINLDLKINGKTIFSGSTIIERIDGARIIGNIKAKPTDEFNIEATINGIKIQTPINYRTYCYKDSQGMYIYAGGDIGAG